MSEFYAQKEKNIKLFRETEEYFANDHELMESVHYSIEASKVYKPRKPNHEGHCKLFNGAGVYVTSRTTIEEAIHIHKKFPEDKIMILNFASAKHPGGRVTQGSSAQEESICRCTTLYDVLNGSYTIQRNYYEYNRNYSELGSQMYSSRGVYTPSIMVFRDDSDPELPFLAKKNRFPVDVFSIPAPNLRTGFNSNAVQPKRSVLSEIYKERIALLLHVAEQKNINQLILGAWGCGVFRNDPMLVAEAFKKMIETYLVWVGTNRIIFAIPEDKDRGNHKAFERVFPYEHSSQRGEKKAKNDKKIYD